MKLSSLERVFNALNAAEVRFLVVGGVAVNAFGYVRLTQDLDLVVRLAPQNLRRCFDVLKQLQYKPVLPVDIEDFLDETKRRTWIRERNLQVFSLVSETLPELTIDLFAKMPFEFEAEYSRAEEHTLSSGARFKTACLDTLMDMKRAAGRHRDLDDLMHLKWIHEERHGETEKE